MYAAKKIWLSLIQSTGVGLSVGDQIHPVLPQWDIVIVEEQEPGSPGVLADVPRHDACLPSRGSIVKDSQRISTQRALPGK
jgi:hypothetical protein